MYINELQLVLQESFTSLHADDSTLLLVIIKDHHRGLEMDTVRLTVTKFFKSHENRLHHPNVEAIHLLDTAEIVEKSEEDKVI